MNVNINSILIMLRQTAEELHCAHARIVEMEVAIREMQKAQLNPDGWKQHVNEGAIPLLEVALASYKRLENHIAAIKEVREITGLGLKEAKDFVEQQWRPQLGR